MAVGTREGAEFLPTPGKDGLESGDDHGLRCHLVVLSDREIGDGDVELHVGEGHVALVVLAQRVDNLVELGLMTLTESPQSRRAGLGSST